MPPRHSLAGPSSSGQSSQLVPPARPTSPSPSGISTGTTTSRTSSASELASNSKKFQRWARGVNLDINIEEELPIDPFFDHIRDLQRTAKTFPDWLANKTSPQFSYIPESYHKSRDDLCSEVARGFELRSHQPDYTGPDQDPKLSAAIPIILQTYHHHEMTADLPDTPTEMDMRIGIDNLIAHVYDVDRSESVKYWTERDLKLPNPNGMTANDSINVATTTADGISFLVFPKFKAYNRLGNVRRALAAYGTGQHKKLIVVHCVVEYKRTDSGANQVMMGLVSGLYQRRGLKMRNHFVFGVFQDNTDHLQVVAAAWRNDEIKVYSIGEYTLIDAITTVQFYLVIRGIKQLAHEYHEELKNSEESFALAIQMDPPKNEWVKTPMQGIQETHGNAGGPDGPGQSGEAGHAGQDDGLSDDLASLGELDSYEKTYTYIQHIRSGSPELAPILMKSRSNHMPDASKEDLDFPQTPPLGTPPTPVHQDTVVLVGDKNSILPGSGYDERLYLLSQSGGLS
ncbi:hypothetical protein FRC11_011392 [Ceratobasidium sp. 423]|nr:hypothetical protein FRC11_011392 [Ceratobasidium sp. 423]